MRQKHCIAGGVILAASVAGAGWAGEGKLGVVSVTAPGLERQVEDVQASVQVIDRRQLDAMSGRSVAQVLQLATGLFVADGGSRTEVYLRGFDDGQTLILVDGQRRTGKYGSTSLSNLQLADLERIEVVRGSMSALYGSEAMGGVINLVTRKPEDGLGFSGSLLGGTAEHGQRGTVIAKGALNLGAAANTSHRVSFQYARRGDFKKDRDSPVTDLLEENRLFLTYNGRLELSPAHWFGWNAEYARQDDEGSGVDRAGDEVPRTEREDRYQAGARYHNEMDDAVLELSGGYGYTDSTSDRGNGDEDTDYRQLEGNAYLTLFPLVGHTTTLGANARRETIEMTVAAGRPARNNFAGLFQDQWEMGGDVSLAAGLRYDYYTDFGVAWSPRATLAWTPGNWSARAGFGTGFKAPSFINLHGSFSRGPYDIGGNPDLDPERSRSVEAAVGYRGARGGVEAVYHHSKIRDLIDAVQVGYIPPPFPGPPGVTVLQYTNVDEATVQGVELSGEYRPGERWWFTATGEYLDAYDDETGGRLTDRPRWQLKLGGTFALEGTELHANLRRVWDYYGIDADRTNSVSDYTVVNAKATRRFAGRHALALGVDNVFDEELPYNMGVFGSPDDPGARFYYAEYRLRL